MRLNASRRPTKDAGSQPRLLPYLSCELHGTDPINRPREHRGIARRLPQPEQSSTLDKDPRRTHPNRTERVNSRQVVSPPHLEALYYLRDCRCSVRT